MSDQPDAMSLALEGARQLVEDQKYEGEGRVLTTAVLLFETSRIDEDGDINYEVSYSVLSNSSLSSSVGTATLGLDVLMDAVTGGDDDE